MDSQMQRPRFVVLADGMRAISADQIRGFRFTGQWPSPVFAELADGAELQVNWPDAMLLAGAFVPAEPGARVICVDARDTLDGALPELREAPLLAHLFLGDAPAAVTPAGILIPPGCYAVQLPGSDEALRMPNGQKFDSAEAFLNWFIAQETVDAIERRAATELPPERTLH